MAADDPRDKDYLVGVLIERLENQRTGPEVAWANPATGSAGTVTIERTYTRDDGAPCRDFRRTTEQVGRPPSVVAGTGCRNGEGVWLIEARAIAATPDRAPPDRAPPVAEATPPPIISPPPPRPDRSVIYANVPIPSTY
ncbi:MAG: hypothetical protein HKM95_10925 [Inquilinus sp.]|nr:hypothetical protein [Inquilinus sp.]